MTTPTQTPNPTTPAPKNSRMRTLVIAGIAALAAVGITTGIVMGTAFAGGGASDNPAPSAPAASTSAGTNGVAPTHHTTPATPSAAVETLQKELGQLNYYEGPVTGIMNTQTTQAITYLQRDAHLPQTGTMNAATQTALANFLAHGNNQMGG